MDPDLELRGRGGGGGGRVFFLTLLAFLPSAMFFFYPK